MKNFEKKALPDLTYNHKSTVNFLRLVTNKENAIDELPCEMAEEFLFELDLKIENYKSFIKNQLKEGLNEIINQEMKRSKESITNQALDYAINEGNYDYDIDENGQYYYTSPTAEIDMDDHADEVVKDCYAAIAIEAYKVSINDSDSIL